MNVSTGIVLLLFPLFGLVADVWLRRYRMIQTSLFILMSYSILCLIIFICLYIVLLSITKINIPESLLSIAIITPTVSIIAAIEIFEANAV